MALSVKTLNKMLHQDPYSRRRLFKILSAKYIFKYALFLISHIYFEISFIECLNNSSTDEIYEKTAVHISTDYKKNTHIAKELHTIRVLDKMQKKLEQITQNN
jgi:hypothetical protein